MHPTSAPEDRHAREFDTVIWLLDRCRWIADGNPGRGEIDQLEHGLQLATRLHRAGMPEEIVLAGLLHDVAKPLSEVHHGEVAAAMLREYVSEGTYHVLRTHGEFQADLCRGTAECVRYCRESWYPLAVRFAAMDAASFSADYDSYPLTRFLAPLRRLYRVG